MPSPETTRVYIRADDHRRLTQLAEHDTRPLVDELQVIISEAMATRGITHPPMENIANDTATE